MIDGTERRFAPGQVTRIDWADGTRYDIPGAPAAAPAPAVPAAAAPQAAAPAAAAPVAAPAPPAPQAAAPPAEQNAVLPRK
jgi:hypothetical protein